MIKDEIAAATEITKLNRKAYIFMIIFIMASSNFLELRKNQDRLIWPIQRGSSYNIIGI